MRSPETYLGNPILSLQTMLRQISDFDPRILPVVPDGLYGASTYASVRSFQEAYDLPANGEVDRRTWDAIVEAHNHILAERMQPRTQPFWFPGQSVQPGERNIHLYLVQAMLVALSQFYPELEVPPVDGIFGPATQRNLQWIQAKAGLPETGNLNTLTWHALNSLYRITTGTGEEMPSS